jgi:hypothetical protein
MSQPSSQHRYNFCRNWSHPENWARPETSNGSVIFPDVGNSQLATSNDNPIHPTSSKSRHLSRSLKTAAATPGCPPGPITSSGPCRGQPVSAGFSSSKDEQLLDVQLHRSGSEMLSDAAALVSGALDSTFQPARRALREDDTQRVPRRVRDLRRASPPVFGWDIRRSLSDRTLPSRDWRSAHQAAGVGGQRQRDCRRHRMSVAARRTAEFLLSRGGVTCCDGYADTTARVAPATGKRPTFCSPVTRSEPFLLVTA